MINILFFVAFVQKLKYIGSQKTIKIVNEVWRKYKNKPFLGQP